MNTISIIFILGTLLGEMKAEPCLVIEEKIITVNGNTSLGGFSCDYEIAEKNDTLRIDKLHLSPYSFTIPIEAFECGNFLLNRDFQTTLKAKTHPQATVEVLRLNENEEGAMTGCIRLTLVGRSKTLDDIEFCMKLYKERQVLSADFVFYASEFKLTPPRKLGGLIKADDAMDITVSLVLKRA